MTELDVYRKLYGDPDTVPHYQAVRTRNLWSNSGIREILFQPYKFDDNKQAIQGR